MKASNLISLVAIFVGIVLGGGVGYFFGKSTRANPSQSERAESLISTTPSSEASTALEAERPLTQDEPPAPRLSFDERVAEVVAIDSHRKQAYEAELLFADLAPGEASGILAKLLAIGDPSERRMFLGPFFLKWAELDGPNALQAAREMEGRDKTYALSAAFAGWGKSDPHAAWAEAELFLEDASLFEAYTARGAISELAKKDLDAALAALNKAGNGWRSNSLSTAVIAAAFESNQAQVLVDKVDAIEDAEQRKEWMSSIFQAWGEMDTSAPLDALSNVSDPALAKGAMEGFMQGWMQTDREGALRYALENHGEPLMTEAIGPILQRAFMQGDKSGNAELAARVVEAGLIDKVARDIVWSMGMSNPELAMQVSGMVSDADAQKEFQRITLSQWAMRDFESAKRHYMELPKGDAKAELLPPLASTLSVRADGGSTLQELMSEVLPGPQRSKAVESLLKSAASPHSRANEAYLEALKGIVANESELSEEARKNRDKLFPQD